MQIRIDSASEFQSMLSALADELVYGQIHFSLYKDLISAHENYGEEFSQSPTFWWLTTEAHLEVAIFRLCKAYDQHKNSLNIKTLIETIRANIDLFDEANFRDRLKDNQYVDGLAKTFRKPDIAQLDTDYAFADEKSNPLVKSLKRWRDNYYAHRSPSHAKDLKSIISNFPLLLDDIELLLREGVKIINRYSNLFAATTHSTNMVGRDDYQTILQCVRESLHAIEDKISEELSRVSEN